MSNDIIEDIINNIEKIENKKLLKLIEDENLKSVDILDYEDFFNKEVIDTYINLGNEKLLSSFFIKKISILNKEDYFKHSSNILDLIKNNIKFLSLKNEILDVIDKKIIKINEEKLILQRFDELDINNKSKIMKIKNL